MRAGWIMPVALGAALMTLQVAVVGAKPKPPQKPPRPQVEVLTQTQLGALRRDAIKVEVSARRAERAVLEGRLFVDGYPEDYEFKLGPEGTKLDQRVGRVRFGLSPRKAEVLDFAAKTCRPASVAVRAEAAGRVRTVRSDLALPDDC